MADTDIRPGHHAGKIDAPSSVSYKDKLLQPSDNDELSHPEEPEMPKLPPTKDEGSPPMTITEAPAGADDAHDDSHQTSAATTNDANSKTPAESDKGQAGEDAKPISIPEPSDDAAVAGTALSDLEKEAMTDPSTADLVAAVTGDPAAAAAAVNEEEVKTNVVTVGPSESSDLKADGANASAVLPGSGDTAAAAGSEGDDSSLRNAPGAALGMPVGTSSGNTAAAAGSDRVEAERDLPHAMSILTASDAAAAGLANLETQLDAGRVFTRNDSSSSFGSGGMSRGSSMMSRGGSVMSRAETCNVIDFTSPAAARDSLPDHMTGSTDTAAAAADSNAKPSSPPAAAAAADKSGGSSSGGSTEPSDTGVAAAYGHLQQAPAAAGDAAAEPAAADVPPGSNDDDQPAAAAAVPEPAVGVEKEGPVVAEDVTDKAVDSTSGGADLMTKEDSSPAAAAAAVDDDGAAKEDDSSSEQNPLVAAAAAVAKPVAAAMTELKDVLLGPDIKIGETSNDDDSSEGKTAE